MKNDGVLLAICLFVIGLAVGAAFSSFFFIRWIDTYMTDSSFAGIGENFMTLQMLRAGEANRAIETLELQMNSEIISYAAMKRHVPVASLNASEVRFIKRVRDYRAVHPYSEDPEIDQSVAGILSLTNNTLWPDKTP